MNWSRELKLAEQAALAAGRRLIDLRRSEIEVLAAEGRDIKLAADREAEAAILEILRASQYGVLAEESGAHGMQSGELAWIVDPLDGSLNYSRGLPICCVSIALWRADQPLLGVIYDFNRDEMFQGIVGEGAWLNGAPIATASTERASQAMATTGFAVKRDFAGDSLAAFIRLLQDFKKVRLLGSAALSLAYVACGRADAYAEDDILFWDIAAGVALVLAAGGQADIRDSPSVEWGKRARCACRGFIWEKG
ncbi:MAG: Inositol-1-monophosphatase [candidate division BRC1 bacterium ADurb.BinA364]|nr:MAG: Inositol-1-monophosphatase [candidate division BRC1 bacterium ADurb.BinA364]